MNWGTIKTQTWWITRTDTNNFAAADMLRMGNEIKKQLVARIVRGVLSSGNANEEEALFNLYDHSTRVAGQQGYMGRYAFPTDLLKIDRVELKLRADGIRYPAKLYDQSQNQYSEYESTEIQAAFSDTSPKVTCQDGEFLIRPLPAEYVVNGGYVVYKMRYPDMSQDSDIPETLPDFHELYVYRLAEKWGERNPELNDPTWSMKALALENSEIAFRKNQFKKNMVISGQTDNFN